MPLSPTAIDSSCYLSQERRCLQEDYTAVEEVLRSVTIPVRTMISLFMAAKSLRSAAQKDALMHQCKEGM